MVKDAQASLRMPTPLKREIATIATETHRTLSNTIELLLWRGVQEFKKDGVLGDRSNTTPQSQMSSRDDVESEQLAGELAVEVLQMALRKARERTSGGGGGPPRKKRLTKAS